SRSAKRTQPGSDSSPAASASVALGFGRSLILQLAGRTARLRRLLRRRIRAATTLTGGRRLCVGQSQGRHGLTVKLSTRLQLLLLLELFQRLDGMGPENPVGFADLEPFAVQRILGLADFVLIDSGGPLVLALTALRHIVVLASLVLAVLLRVRFGRLCA